MMQEQRCPYKHPDRAGVCDALLFRGEGTATVETSCWRCHRLVLVHLDAFTSSSAVTIEVDKEVVIA
jgi:phage FluMu protein Com